MFRAVWLRRAGKKWRGLGGGNFLPASRCGFCAAPAARHYPTSGFSDKVGSSEVIKILQHKTTPQGVVLLKFTPVDTKINLE